MERKPLMNLASNRTWILASAFALLACAHQNAGAMTLNATLQAGASNLNGTSANGLDSMAALLGGELTVDLGTYVETGIFFENNFLNYDVGGNGSLTFYGAVLRIGLLGPGSDLYADTKLGISQRTGGIFTSEHGAGLGVGSGYRFWLTPFLDLSPRLGFRILPEPFQGTRASNLTIDGSLLLRFGF